MTSKSFPIPSERGGEHISAVTVERGKYVCAVAVNGREILSKIYGLPWTVAPEIEPWELADAAKALCLK